MSSIWLNMSGFQLVCVLLLALFVFGIGFSLDHRRIGSAIWIPTDLLNDVEEATARITDVTSFAADGSPKIIIDWKSDVDLAAETVEHYRVLVRSYLRTMGKPDGLIVFVTTGTIPRSVHS